jgi:cyanophycinase-like exopeptidase
VGAASNDDRGFFGWLIGYLRAAGAGTLRLAPTAGRGADVEEARRVLDDADVVFVSGGDVERGMRTLARSGLDAYLRGLGRAGKRFIGLSAGSIMLALRWVRWPDPANDARAETFSCLGLAPVLCDTHSEEDDWEELRALLRLAGGTRTGYGIPSGGALRVSPRRRVEALGVAVQRFRLRGGAILPLPDLLPATSRGSAPARRF